MAAPPRSGGHQQQSDGPGADRHPGRDGRPFDIGIRLPGPAGHCENHLRQCPGADHQPARREGSGFGDRPGSARSGPASTTACARWVEPNSAGLDGEPATPDRLRGHWPTRAWFNRQIAKSRNEIDQARLLCEKAAWTIDQHGNRAAHLLVSRSRRWPADDCDVIDRAIQVPGRRGQRGHGAGPTVSLAARHGASSTGRMRCICGPCTR